MTWGLCAKLAEQGDFQEEAAPQTEASQPKRQMAVPWHPVSIAKAHPEDITPQVPGVFG